MKHLFKKVRKNWLQWGLLAFILYQVIFTWIPVWRDAHELEGMDVSTVSLENDQGKLIALSDFQGQPLIVNFWASWCVPCRLELPLLAQIYPDLLENNKQLIGVNVSEPWSTIHRFREKTNFEFPVFRDNGVLSEKLRIQMIPSIVVIGPQGKVVSITAGFRPWIQAYLLWWI